MGKLTIDANGICSVDWQEVEIGTTLRCYDEGEGQWFEGELRLGLVPYLVQKLHAPLPLAQRLLSGGETVEIVHCHSNGDRCDKNQKVRVQGREYAAAVHCIHPVKGYSTLFGIVQEPKRRASVRLIAGSDTWEEYDGLGLDPEHWIGGEDRRFA